jgi:hypothetical protein
MSNTFILEIPKTKGATSKSAKIPSRLTVNDSTFHVESMRPKTKGVQSKSSKDTFVLHPDSDSGKNSWDEAHEIFENLAAKGARPNYLEPEMDHLLFDPRKIVKSKMAGEQGYLHNWPQPEGTLPIKYAWHLNDAFSQLKRAREIAEPYFQEGRAVKIAHLDTGYDPKHPCLPRKLRTDEAFCFVPGVEGKHAMDVDRGTSIEQQWHGQATLAILAGGYVEMFEKNTPFGMDFGGAPLAEVLPVRISDSVALLKTSAFAHALDYITDHGCEVLTMSMAGLPSMTWATAVNRAYEKGVTLVVAAGNSWISGAMRYLPKCVLYPGRWERVIAAAGMACNRAPYVFDANPFFNPPGHSGLGSSEYMQGNFGPASAMKTTLAAYTPNIPWAARIGKDGFWSLSGGGTSSATPQIAAAAALWIQRFRKKLDQAGYSGTWKQVEAVRYALFNTADKSYPEYEKYFGNGTLKASDALDEKWFPTEDKLTKSPKADLFLPLFQLFFGSRKSAAPANQRAMLATELLQLAHLNPELQDMLTMDISTADLRARQNLPSKEQLMNLRDAIRQTQSSRKLKEFLRL